MTFPSNVSGLYCHGCTPGDFPQPHICGITSRYTGGLTVGPTAGDMSPCGVCGTLVWPGAVHSCGGTVTYPASIQSWSVRNGPICDQCNQGYLGRHDCSVEPIPCPDGLEGCTIRHFRHKAPPARRD